MEKVRLCVMSYSHLSRVAMQVAQEFALQADIEVVDYTFEKALAHARERERLCEVDAFVSAGSNAAILKGALATPVATIKVAGYDILVALRNARRYSTRVGILTYGFTIAELDAVKGLIDVDIVQGAYRTLDEASAAFEALVAEGCAVFVGSSIVVELAEQNGLPGVLAYSDASVRQGLQDAIDLARVAQLETAKYDQLNGVLHNLQEAVLAVNRAGAVIALNSPMETVLGRTRSDLLGAHIDEVAPEFSLTSTLANEREERQQMCQFNRREWLVNRTLIRERGQVVGATLTLYDAATIQEADSTLRAQNRLRNIPQARWRFEDLLGTSAEFRRARDSAMRFATTDRTVLITGESGTGKELFAQAIHLAGARRDRPFLAINCAAVPEALLESELFGHEEGSFTGARKGGKRGLLEAAHTGTLFLDEIGDMPVLLQTRLLRVLQEREVVRVGGVVPIPVDVRVVAATHQPLDRLVQERRFRADLFYRLNILRLQLPPLRDRAADIEPLARDFVTRALRGTGKGVKSNELLAPLIARLRGYRWPGNVRELENICERIAVAAATHKGLDASVYAELELDCPELFAGEAKAVHGDATEPGDLAEVLASCAGNRIEAARRLGISRATLWRRMKSAGL